MTPHTWRSRSKLLQGDFFLRRKSLRAPVRARAASLEPRQEPNQPDEAGEEERRAPPIVHRNENDHGRRDHRTQNAPAIENPQREGALVGREKFSHRLYAGGIIAALEHTHYKTQAAKRADGSGQGLQRVGERPPREQAGHRGAKSDPIDKRPGGDLAQRHPQREGEHDVGVLRAGEVQCGLKRGRHGPQHQPVHEVYGHGNEEEDGNPPRVEGGRHDRRGRGLVWFHNLPRQE